MPIGYSSAERRQPPPGLSKQAVASPAGQSLPAVGEPASDTLRQATVALAPLPGLTDAGTRPGAAGGDRPGDRLDDDLVTAGQGTRFVCDAFPDAVSRRPRRVDLGRSCEGGLRAEPVSRLRWDDAGTRTQSPRWGVGVRSSPQPATTRPAECARAGQASWRLEAGSCRARNQVKWRPLLPSDTLPCQPFRK